MANTEVEKEDYRRVPKSFTIEKRIIKKLKKEKNASDMVNKLLLKKYRLKENK